MAQQNLVSYILSQYRAGKSLKDINEFLITAGYDKEEVESSVQYVINLEKNPELAEQQRIQQLAQYIQTQVDNGYDKHVITNFLISKGYPYYEVNSALNILKTSPVAEAKVEHKLAIVAIVTIIMVSVGIGIFYLSAMGEPSAPAKLLDVSTNKLTTLAKPGSDLNFQVNVINLGEIKRYDISLDYQIVDRVTDEPVSQQQETVAISTSTQRVVSLPIPKTLSPGNYLLKATASYEQFNASSGFLFEVVPSEEAEAIEEGVEEMVPEPANVTDVAPEVPEVAPPVPETVPETPANITPEIPEVEIPETEEDIFLSKTKAEAIEFVKAVSVRDPSKAVSLCKKFTYDSQKRECIRELAGFKKDPAFCNNLENTAAKDSCLFQIITDTQQTDMCRFISDANIRQSCDVMGQMMQVAEEQGVKNQMPEVDLFLGEGLGGA